MLIVAIVAILVSMGLVIMRGLVGPTIYDRILAANSFGTHAVVVIALLGDVVGTYFFLDIAVTYALINFLSTVALLRYFRYGTFGGK